MRQVVGALGSGWLAAEIGLQGDVNLLGGELAADAERAKVIGVVAHAGVLPVDEVVPVGIVDEEIEHEEVVVAEAHGGGVRHDEGLQGVGVRGVLGVARDVDGSLLKKEGLIALGLLIEVEGRLHRDAGLVERAGHLHGAGHLSGVVWVEVLAVGDEAGDLPAALGVLVDEGLVDAQLFGRFLSCYLAGAVDEELSANAGMAVDVLAVVGGEVTREVCQALLERVDVVNLRLGAAQDGDDVVKDLRVHVLQEVRVEGAQLV